MEIKMLHKKGYANQAAREHLSSLKKRADQPGDIECPQCKRQRGVDEKCWWCNDPPIDLEPPRAVSTKTHPEEDGGITTFSDGTIAYWNERSTTYKYPDGTQEKYNNNADDTAYRDIFDSDEYGTVEDMTDSEISVWSDYL